jgi:hypothetical protein
MFSQAYFTLTVKRLFQDGRNEAKSNLKPRSVGSSASRILRLLDGSHYGVQASAIQERTLRLWIETGAPYPGTYAALGSGMLGGYAQNAQDHTDFDWPTTRAGTQVLDRRCGSCHQGNRRLPHAIADEIDISFWRFDLQDPRLQFSRHRVFNLDQPAKSLLLLAPLAVSAGGLGLCRTNAQDAVLPTVEDPDYRLLLAMVDAGRAELGRLKRFDMADFQPRPEWVREMRRYGVLAGTPELPLPRFTRSEIDACERRYWESLWPKSQ